MTTLWQVSQWASPQALEEIFLQIHEHEGVLSASLFGDGDPVELRAYASDASAARRFAAHLADMLGTQPDITPVPDENWVALTQQALGPIMAGRFRVHGSHDGPQDGFLNICIDAGEAFGTGHHETTAGCLEALDGLLAGRRFNHALDIGTGSGVLAIAIASASQTPVLANDIEPIAVEVAARNVAANGVRDRVSCEYGDGAQEIANRGARFDLICANILAGPLIDIAPDVARLATPGAAIVLSGLLITQQEDVVAAYRAQGATLIRAIHRGEWAALVLEKSD